ncbi:MAG: hypothetical protein NUV64_02535 [Parcubacteria group bacterium]|nr:hypothetical protein [Parcubacteria group bacterium]MCR4343051.1 hypothetical protein [Patescibacteria group bacterium]
MWWIKWPKREEASLYKKHVLYNDKIWSIEEEGRGWLVISDGVRKLFCDKKDTDYFDYKKEDIESLAGW